jgi:hypothetical protein
MSTIGVLYLIENDQSLAALATGLIIISVMVLVVADAISRIRRWRQKKER